MNKWTKFRNFKATLDDDEITIVTLLVHLAINIPYVLRALKTILNVVYISTSWSFLKFISYNFKTFNILIKVYNCYDKIYVVGRSHVPLEKAFLMTTWWLRKGEVLSNMANRFIVAV